MTTRKPRKNAPEGVRRRKVAASATQVSPETRNRVLDDSGAILRAALASEGMSAYAAHVIATLREALEEQDARITRLERRR